MLTITIDTSRFAPEDVEYEVERALKGLAERWQTATKVMDLNGNSVGTVSYDETQSDEDSIRPCAASSA